MSKYYKVLRDGRSNHGGNMQWSLPTQADDGSWTPGEWMGVEGNLVMCAHGLHLTSNVRAWFDHPECAVYATQYEGALPETNGDKICVRRVRLMRRLSDAELAEHSIYIVRDGAIEAGDGVVWATGYATVRAYENATVRAYENATVRAYENVTVQATGNATVQATGNATVQAYENATVRATGNVTVRAYENATVEAYENATMRAYNNATVRASGNATVRAYDNATVEAYDNATVEANGNATVQAYENATVRANGNVTVRAYENATVLTFQKGTTITLFEQAVWIERCGGVPACHVAAEPWGS